jgi:D-alanyl-D-alanine carboxypeptidase
MQEEGLKNKTLEEKLISLDKLTRSDPKLLQKYSKIYFLNENYTPREIGNISSDYIFNKKVEYKLHVDVIYFLLSMIDDARKEGLNPLIISAYRSFDSQVNLKAKNKVTYGSNTANRFVAEQGYSEHQLGTTVDLTIPSIGSVSMTFDKTKEYEWLQNNAHKYGFILSYPKSNAYYAYEPWHWRFVGIDLATQLHQDNIYFYNLDQRKIDDYLVNIFDK